MASKPLSLLVIGAGPAGSLAAYLLARQGHQVTLAEQHRFPRDKVCGECLSHLALTTLADAGLSPVLNSLKPNPLTHATLVSAKGFAVIHPLPNPMAGLTRRTLDQALLTAAQEAGAKLLQPARAESLRGTTATLRLEDNTLHTATYDLILLADGKSSLLASKPKLTPDLGIKAHFRNLGADPHAIHLFTLPHHSAGLARVEGDLWNLALSAPASLIKSFKGNLEAYWSHVLATHSHLAEIFRNAAPAIDFLASPLPRFPLRPATDYPKGILPLGNAAAALEPIGGEGMGLALQSATRAVAAITEHGAQTTASHLQELYRPLWRTRRPACRVAALSLSHPTLSGPLLHLSKSAPALTRQVMALMGK